jgi:hypothetical protein
MSKFLSDDSTLPSQLSRISSAALKVVAVSDHNTLKRPSPILAVAMLLCVKAVFDGSGVWAWRMDRYAVRCSA